VESTNTARLAVVIPAHNEAPHVLGCVQSVRSQDLDIRILVSDNASQDATPELIRQLPGQPDRVQTRRVPLMAPSAHFTSSGRWALASGREEYLAFLAADDRWEPGFAQAAITALERNPGAGMAYPTFVWRGEGGQDRRLTPPRLGQRSAGARQVSALMLPDRAELANQLYGVFRRNAFELLLAAWERGGEGLGVDYASVLCVLGRCSSVPVPEATAVRILRDGQDLIERAGIARPVNPTPVRLAATYLRLNVRINAEIGRARSRVSGRPLAITVASTQLLRAPQWLADIPRQVKGQPWRPLGAPSEDARR
jgi:glycosyltransferase involved in cell wall biosynthesis